jgi:membrane dipeptidase
MLIIDGHLDLAMNALYLQRDLKKSAHQLRRDEAGLSGYGLGGATVGFPDLRAGRVGLVFATFIARSRPRGQSNIDFADQIAAYAHAQGQLAYYRQLEREGEIHIIADSAALERHLAEWNDRPETATLGIILSMEGADPIVHPGQLADWYRDGLRILSLVHYGPGVYAFGTGTTGPLTPAGRELLAEMERLGMILDVTHLSDMGFDEAMSRFSGPVLATHSNCRALVPNQRQLSDDQLKALIARDAVIGSAMDAWMLQPGWVIGITPPDNCTLDMFVDQIDHVCQLAGNARHAAIGTDLDGGYGTEQTPRDLDTIADLQTIPAKLSARGYAQSDIDAIMHGNWVRLIKRVWGLPH